MRVNIPRMRGADAWMSLGEGMQVQVPAYDTRSPEHPRHGPHREERPVRNRREAAKLCLAAQDEETARDRAHER